MAISLEYNVLVPLSRGQSKPYRKRHEGIQVVEVDEIIFKKRQLLISDVKSYVSSSNGQYMYQTYMYLYHHHIISIYIYIYYIICIIFNVRSYIIIKWRIFPLEHDMQIIKVDEPIKPWGCCRGTLSTMRLYTKQQATARWTQESI